MYYHEVFVSYDISEDKNRNKIFKKLKDLGLKPIQKSLFWGYIKYTDLKNIDKFLSYYIDKKTDKCLVIKGSIKNSVIKAFGYNVKKDFPQLSSYEYLII